MKSVLGFIELHLDMNGEPLTVRADSIDLFQKMEGQKGTRIRSGTPGYDYHVKESYQEVRRLLEESKNYPVLLPLAHPHTEG